MKPAFCRDAGFSSRPDYGRVEMSGTSELYPSRSIVVTQQLQRKWYRRQRADGDQRPTDRSPLLTAQLFRKQQRDARAEHCTRAGDKTDLRNGDFVLFHLSSPSFDRNVLPHIRGGPASRAPPPLEFEKCRQCF